MAETLPRTKPFLDHYLLFDEWYLDNLFRVYLSFYHQHRPHQALSNEPLGRRRKRRKPIRDDISLSLRDVR